MSSGDVTVGGSRWEKKFKGIIFLIAAADFVLIYALNRFTLILEIWIAVLAALFIGFFSYLILSLRILYPLSKRHERISQALLEAEQKSQSVFKTAANLIISLNENGIIIDCNSRIINILGYAPNQLMGESIMKIIHPEHTARARKSLRTIIMDQAVLNEELRMIKADGRVIDVSINSSSLKDRNGNLVMALWIIDDITERKKVEETLRLIRFSIDKSLDPVFWIGPDANFVSVNDAACAALGYTRTELLNLSIKDIDPEYSDEKWLLLWSRLKHEKSFTSESVLKTKAGRTFPVEIVVNFIDFEGREINCAFVRDITQRKRAEMELKAINEQLRTSIEHMPLAYILWDIEYKVIEWNRAAEKIFGFKREEVLGKALPGLVIPPQNQQMAGKVFRQLLEGVPSSFSYEDNNIQKDGSIISCNWLNMPLTGKDGEVFAVLSMVNDITEQIRIQRELRTANEKFKELTEMLPQTVFELDTRGYFTYANKHGIEFSGFSPQEIKAGVHASQLILAEEKERLEAILKKVLNGEKINGVEFTMKGRSGIKSSIAIFASPIVSGSNIVGVRGIAVDITETKRLQDLVSRAQKLEIAGRIAGQVAHDFNNLLGPLFAFPEFIKEALPDNSPAAGYLDHIEKAAEQMAEINKQLLTLGRRGHYNQVALNINDIVKQVLKDNWGNYKQLDVVLDLDDELGLFKGGAAQVARALTNLINNSCDAMDGKGKLTIKTENFHVDNLWSRYGKVPEGDYIKLTISDSGQGISETDMPHIFDPFFSTKSADNKSGSGLGLSIVHSVLEDHNGYIDVKSEPGKGSSFYLYFPMTLENIEIDDPSEIVSGGDEVIMVVDDDGLQRNVTTSLLKKLGYEVLEVESGEQAVEMIKSTSPDLILLDMMMYPGIDGAETFKRICEIKPGQKALIVSGYADSDKIDDAIKLGVGGFVGKPLSLKSLSGAIRKALSGKKVNI